MTASPIEQLDLQYERELHPLHACVSLGQELVNSTRQLTGETAYYFVDTEGRHCLITDTYKEDVVLTTKHPVEVYNNPEMLQLYVGSNEKHRTTIFVVRAPPHENYQAGIVSQEVLLPYEPDDLTPLEACGEKYRNEVPDVKPQYGRYNFMTDSSNKADIFLCEALYGGIEMFPWFDWDITEHNIKDAIYNVLATGAETVVYEPPPATHSTLVSEAFVAILEDLDAIKIQRYRDERFARDPYTIYLLVC